MADLKPCPFCGGKARIIAYDPFDGYQGNCTVYLAGCVVCGAEIKKATEEKAIEAWNRRYTPEEIDFDYAAEDE